MLSNVPVWAESELQFYNVNKFVSENRKMVVALGITIYIDGDIAWKDWT